MLHVGPIAPLLVAAWHPDAFCEAAVGDVHTAGLVCDECGGLQQQKKAMGILCMPWADKNRQQLLTAWLGCADQGMRTVCGRCWLRQLHWGCMQDQRSRKHWQGGCPNHLLLAPR